MKKWSKPSVEELSLKMTYDDKICNCGANPKANAHAHKITCPINPNYVGAILPPIGGDDDDNVEPLS